MGGFRAGVVGQPIAHSLSPVLHRAAYQALGLPDWRYEAMECDEAGFPSFIAALSADWAGLSLTMPVKRVGLQLAATASPLAVAVGAANTLVRRSGGWWADNTDVPGMMDALATVGYRRAERPIILGAGGTAQAALAALAQLAEAAQQPAQATVVLRDPGRAGAALAAAARLGVDVELVTFVDLPSRVADADLVLSTLPASAGATLADLPLSADTVVFDVVYAPWPTPLAAAAQRRGCPVVSGLELLLQQAGYQVTAMTGRPAPLAAMRAALDAAC